MYVCFSNVNFINTMIILKKMQVKIEKEQNTATGL